MFDVVISPTQGFCNRLRSLASAYVLADYMNTNIYVNWVPEKCCNIAINDVFETKFNSIDVNVLKASLYYFNPQKHTNEILQAYVNDDQVCDWTRLKYLVIEGGHEFKHPEMSTIDYLSRKHAFYRKLKFISPIEKEVERYQNSRTTKTTRIGVHFRDYVAAYDQADGRMFSQDSPFPKFTEIVERLLNSSRGTSASIELYVTSNSEEILNRFREQYGGRATVINYTTPEGRDLSRDTTWGVQQAIIEMLLLSRCDILVGTYYSSFSDEACFFQMVPKICITAKVPQDNGYHCHGFGKVEDMYMVLPDLRTIVEYMT